jgi:hypothetical protein
MVLHVTKTTSAKRVVILDEKTQLVCYHEVKNELGGVVVAEGMKDELEHDGSCEYGKCRKQRSIRER